MEGRKGWAAIERERERKKKRDCVRSVLVEVEGLFIRTSLSHCWLSWEEMHIKSQKPNRGKILVVTSKE